MTKLHAQHIECKMLVSCDMLLHLAFDFVYNLLLTFSLITGRPGGCGGVREVGEGLGRGWGGVREVGGRLVGRLGR